MSRPKSHLAVLMNCIPGAFTGVLFRTTVRLMMNCRPAVTMGMLSNVSTLPTLVNVCGTGVPSSSQVMVWLTYVRSTTVAVAGSNRTGIVSFQVKGTPTVTKGGPGGFAFSIFSTGISRFWQLCLSVLDEPLTNQSLFS